MAQENEEAKKETADQVEVDKKEAAEKASKETAIAAEEKEPDVKEKEKEPQKEATEKKEIEIEKKIVAQQAVKNAAEKEEAEKVETEKKEAEEEEEVEQEPKKVIKKEATIEPTQAPVAKKLEIKEKIEVKSAQEIAKEVEEVGIDTIDIDEPQGNWLFKRMWWEHAEKRYEKIRELVQKIWESRMNFFVKRTELDKMVLDPFYISIGLGQGELYEILTELIGRIEKERKEEGVLSQSERSLLTRLQAEQQLLEQTKRDVESINKLDQGIDQALNRLMEQINRVRTYEQEAWEHFKNIARVLNDAKARELFFKIDTVLRNIKSIDDYLQQDFTQHFNQLLQRINNQVTKVTNELQGLKEKGIDFKKQVDTIEAEEEQEPELQEEVEEEKEEKITPGWGTQLWDNVVAIVRWPYDKLMGTKEIEPSE